MSDTIKPAKNKPSKRTVIDPHIHLFNLEQGKYEWLKSGNPPFWNDKSLICKTTHESELTTNKALKLEAYVHIEAGFDNKQPCNELDWLNQHCQLPYKAITHVDLSKDLGAFCAQIKDFAQYESFIGIRDIIDASFVENLKIQNAKKNLQKLAEHGYIFELQVDFNQHKHVNLILDVLANVTDLRFSINHAGFAPFNDAPAFLEWEHTLQKFAQFDNCIIKVSGLEMTSREYSNLHLERVIRACCDEFGQERVMLASNFPLLELGRIYDSEGKPQRLDYERYWCTILRVSDALGLDTSKLSHANAKSFYRL